MRYKQYGNTKIRVSAIGFGGMRFDMSQPESSHIDLVHYAFERGINYFDTAPGYCNDQSEIIFGKALSTLPRDQVVISTKLMPGSIKNKTEALDRIKRSCDRLQTDYIDIFHAWNFRNMAQYADCIRPDGLYDAMLQAQADGLIRHLAFSTHLTGNKASEIVESGRFAGILLGLNIMNFPYRLEAVAAARSRGMGVVAMNSLYGGLIPQYESKFAFIARGNESPTLSALRFAAGLELLDVALNGFTEIKHIDMACRAADSAESITIDDLPEYRELIGNAMDGFCTGCGYCKECPANLNVPVLMQFYNYKMIENASQQSMIEKLAVNRIWGILPENQTPARACLHCRQCEKNCTQHLPITSRLQEIAVWEAAADRINQENK